MSRESLSHELRQRQPLADQRNRRGYDDQRRPRPAFHGMQARAGQVKIVKAGFGRKQHALIVAGKSSPFLWGILAGNPKENMKKGILYGIGAYALWGFFPLYWKM